MSAIIEQILKHWKKTFYIYLLSYYMLYTVSACSFVHDHSYYHKNFTILTDEAHSAEISISKLI
jgi:hypothetical protein